MVAVEVTVTVTVVVAGKVIVRVAVIVEVSFGPAKNKFHDAFVKCCRSFASVVILANGSRLDEDRASQHVIFWYLCGQIIRCIPLWEKDSEKHY